MMSVVDENVVVKEEEQEEVQKTPDNNKCDVTVLDFDNDDDTPKRIHEYGFDQYLKFLGY